MIHENQKNAIYDQSWKIVESMRNPTKRENPMQPSAYDIEINNLQKMIRKIPEIFDYVSDHDVRDFFFFRLTMVEKLSVPSIDRESLKKAIDRYFFSEPNVSDYFFRIARAGDFPEGFEIGTGNMISYDNLPEDVKASLGQHWRMFFEDDKFAWEKNVEEYIERQRKYAYICFPIKSIGGFKSSEKAYLEVRKNTNIFKFVYGDSFYGEITSVPYLYCWKIGQNSGAHLSHSYRPEEFHRVEFLDDRIEEISKIIKKQNRDDVEQRLVNAIEICGLIEHETPVRVRFLLKMICLEAILLGKDDRDYLGWKLSEKISLLVGDTKAWMYNYFKLNFENKIDEQFIKDNRINSMIGLEKKVKKLYETRSTFAHGNTSDYETNSEIEEEYGLLTSLLYWITEKILELHNAGIARINKTSTDDKTSLDYHVQTLKYAKS